MTSVVRPAIRVSRITSYNVCYTKLLRLLAIVLFVLALFIIKKVGNIKLREMRKAGIVLLVLIIAEMLLVNVVKIIWARPRMRSIESARNNFV